ncbi:MAG: hypothetical protein PUC60_07015 [Clostridiales bacterium]|nr:hypothetical protein [Clostridiales bacterium]
MAVIASDRQSATTWQEATKMMPTQNADVDLNRQKHIAGEISLTRWESILLNYEMFG